MNNEKLTGIISIRAQWMLSLDFTWMSTNQWMSTAWLLSDILRYVERLQERGLVCSYERREWGHKGYWHILINADQQEAVARVVAEDHAAWLVEKAENDARYAASLIGNPEHEHIDFEF